MLTKKQFDILTAAERAGVRTQRTLSAETGMSLGAVNKTMTELVTEGLIEHGTVTQKGLDALEPYRVKRAVFLAAGFGERLRPITLNTPKPLVKVHGRRIIDSLLDACQAAEISEIYVVRGYLAELFDQLLYKYPNVKFIENPHYSEENNISSIVCARDLLKSAYVFESDLLLHNPALVTKYQYCTNYLGVPVKLTNDWCFTVKNGVVTNFSLGGTDCFHMFGISYWSAEDGEKLGKDAERVYKAPGGKEHFWDDVALTCCRQNYKIAVRECSFDDIAEIDTYRELKSIDKAYEI